MRVSAFPIMASIVLLAAPAFAQTSTNPSPQRAGKSATAKATSSTLTLDTQQKIRQSLEQSGFKNVRVVPESFVIHAQAPNGSHIAMMISPDAVTGVVEETGTSTQPQASGQAAR